MDNDNDDEREKERLASLRRELVSLGLPVNQIDELEVTMTRLRKVAGVTQPVVFFAAVLATMSGHYVEHSSKVASTRLATYTEAVCASLSGITGWNAGELGDDDAINSALQASLSSLIHLWATLMGPDRTRQLVQGIMLEAGLLYLGHDAIKQMCAEHQAQHFAVGAALTISNIQEAQAEAEAANSEPPN